MTSLMDPVERWASRSPAAVALRDPAGDLTYDGLERAARRLATTLQGWSVSPGQHVVLLAPAVPEFVVAYLGIQAAGAVLVPMNTMSRADEIRYVLQDADVRAVLVWPDLGPAAAEAAAGLDVPLHELHQDLWGPDVPPVEVVRRDVDDTAAILYTSGTTGRPKGAQLTVGNVLAAGEISGEISNGTPADRVGSALPLFHIFGQISVMMSALTAGCSLSLLHPFEPKAMLDMIRRDRLTVIAGVPTMWNAVLRLQDDGSQPALDHVRLAVSGGAALPGPVARDFERRFGCELLEGYGLTETTSQGTFNRGGKPGSVGRAVPRTRLEVRDSAGNAAGPDEVGEIHILGPSVMKGYWRRPEDTASVLAADGWLRTGDLGRFDADGELFIVDRLKDLIIRGGYNVYPAEVEEVLYDHPDIVEAAVIGVPDDYYGEEVAAVVVLREGVVLGSDEVIAWSRAHLSAYKIPRLVRFVDELPKGPSGKILKRAIDTTGLRPA